MIADDLIELAFELARRDVGRPKSVSLRRSASTAYYALFHALAGLCAEQLVGLQKGWHVFTPIYRSLDHAKAKSVLNAVRRERHKGSSLDVVAVAFVTLQDARHDADYNPEPFRFKRSETLELIEAAQAAIAALGDLPAHEKLVLAVQLVAKSR